MITSYPDYRKHLKQRTTELQQRLPSVMTAFGRLHGSGMAKGELSAAQKELIALGIAVAVRCDGCITFHVREALAAGATAQQIAECVGVAIVMGGGPAAIYGAEALEAARQFQAAEHSQLPPDA